MVDGIDRVTIGKLVVVFVVAWAAITTFELLRADLSAGALRPETGGLLIGLVAIGVAYWWLSANGHLER